jgi:DNA-binding XRE family transcriptional regulator
MPTVQKTKWRDARKLVVKPDDERFIEQGREAIRAELQLAAVRKHRKASQATVAQRLAVSQSNVSQLERGDDLRLSTLVGYIDALGGTVEVRAIFDDETITLSGGEIKNVAIAGNVKGARRRISKAKTGRTAKTSRRVKAAKAVAKAKRAGSIKA